MELINRPVHNASHTVGAIEHEVEGILPDSVQQLVPDILPNILPGKAPHAEIVRQKCNQSSLLPLFVTTRYD